MTATKSPAETTAIKLFDRWGYEGIVVNDKGIHDYVSLHPVIFPKSGGRHARQQFYKSKVNIVERLLNKMFVAGHKGKKHKFTSRQCTGKTETNVAVLLEAFRIVEEKTKKNPIEVLVKAVENGSPVEEVLTYQKGGIFAREAVITSPQRRVDMALRHIAQGAFAKSHSNKKTAAQCLADELIAASNNDSSSVAVSTKTQKEKEAWGAR